MARQTYTDELQKSVLKNYLASLHDNSTILLHSFSMKFDYEVPKPSSDESSPESEALPEEDEQLKQDIVRNEVKARFSLQTRTLLDMMGVKEADIYKDADQ